MGLVFRRRNRYGMDTELQQLPGWLTALPTVNASLNALSGLLLVLGLWLIRRGHRQAHRNVMLTAFVVSIVFLACYLIYHEGLHRYTGAHGRAFAGTGVLRWLYYAILVSHVLLAAAVPVLAIITIVRGLRGDWERHRRIAGITFPIWLYVSITGVIIYAMLYHLPIG